MKKIINNLISYIRIHIVLFSNKKRRETQTTKKNIKRAVYVNGLNSMLLTLRNMDIEVNFESYLIHKFFTPNLTRLLLESRFNVTNIRDLIHVQVDDLLKAVASFPEDEFVPFC